MMKDRKAQIPSTLTWIIGFLIIFFVMIIFLSSTIVFSGLKGVDVDEPVKYNLGVLESQRILIGFLNSPVEVGGEPKEMQDLILASLEPYFTLKDKHKGEKTLIDWAGSFYKGTRPLEQIGIVDASDMFEESKLVDLQDANNKFGEEIAGRLDKECCECFLQIPQGIVRAGSSVEDKGKGLRQRKDTAGLGAIQDDPFNINDENYKDWKPIVSIMIPYEGRIFKIRYRESGKC